MTESGVLRMSERLYTLPEAARIMRVSERTVRRCLKGEARSFPRLEGKRHARGRYVFTRGQLDDWIRRLDDVT